MISNTKNAQKPIKKKFIKPRECISKSGDFIIQLIKLTFQLSFSGDTFMFKPVYDLIFLQTMHISWKGHGQDFDDSVRGSYEPNITGIIRVQQP